MKKIIMLLKGIRPTVVRYPFVLCTSLLGATLSFMTSANLIEDGTFLDSYCFSMLIASLTGISLLFGLNMIGERLGQRYIYGGIGVVVLVLYAYLLPDNDRLQEAIVFQYWVFGIALATHLWVAISPYVIFPEKESFWSYNQSIFVSATTAAIFTCIMTGGLMLALSAIQNLFGVRIQDFHLYSFVMNYASIFGSSLIFLLLLDGGLDSLEKRHDYPAVLRFLVQYILIPLLLIYALIFYAYIVKIVVAWELPKGYLSYLVLAYSILGILSYLLVYPLRDSSEHKWVRYFSDVFYYTLIPLVVVLYVAIFTRVLDYGYTENRYILVALAFWLTSVVVVMILTNGKYIYYIPVSLLVVTLFALFAPHFNMFSTSIRSQKSKLIATLEDNNLLENGKMLLKDTIHARVSDDISSRFKYLHDRGEVKFIKATTGIAHSDDRPAIDVLNGKLNKVSIRSRKYQYFYQHDDMARGTHTIIGDFDILIDDFSSDNTGKHTLTEDISISWNGDEITLKSKGVEYRHSIKPYLENLADQYKDAEESVYNVKKLAWDVTVGNIDMRVDLDRYILLYPSEHFAGKLWIRLPKE